jgi:hypothetical protein
MDVVDATEVAELVGVEAPVVGAAPTSSAASFPHAATNTASINHTIRLMRASASTFSSTYGRWWCSFSSENRSMYPPHRRGSGVALATTPQKPGRPAQNNPAVNPESTA